MFCYAVSSRQKFIHSFCKWHCFGFCGFDWNMAKGRVDLDDLMSFSSDEEDNRAITSGESWLAVLSSEFNAGARIRSGTESTRSLSPIFFDGRQSSGGRNSNRNSNHDMQSAKTETRSAHLDLASGGKHLNPFRIDFSSDSEAGRNSLFNQDSRLRASRSCDELSPPRSPVKKPANIPQFPHGGFSSYHTLFKPPSDLVDFQSPTASNGREAVQRVQSPVSFS